MKYKLSEKRKRNMLLVEYQKANPELTMSEIGDTFGISKQRVKQILDLTKKKDGHNVKAG